MEKQMYYNLSTTSFHAMIQITPGDSFERFMPTVLPTSNNYTKDTVAQVFVTDSTGNTVESDPFILRNGSEHLMYRSRKTGLIFFCSKQQLYTVKLW
jgi:hypothetical protein